MVSVNIPEKLYDDFIKEKENLDSTLSTIEILKDKQLLNEINKGISEIENGETSTFTINEIDNL